MNLFTDSKLKFEPEKHKYFYEGKELQSVTTILKRFTPQFDTEKWSKVIAEREGVSVKEIQDRWTLKNKLACDFGSRIHQYAESKVLSITPEITLDMKDIEYRNQVNDFLQWLSIGFQFSEREFLCEQQICYPELGIAGTVDLLMKTVEGYYIMDWKTNESIEETNTYGERLLKPLQHLFNCELIKYTLQLNLYRYILEKKYNLKIKGLYLIHLLPTEFRFIQCESMDSEVESILKILNK